MITNKLQGTDGIRGKIAYTNPSHPLQYFLEQHLLTPPFFDRYTYAYATLLLSTNFAKTGDSIIVGWDPRDPRGDFNQAAIHGLQKAGLNVITVGILPTPAIVFYMLATQSAGAIMLTASHNPSDQNGIKLFHGYTGLKFLPGDDQKLTEKIFQQEEDNLQDFPLIGKVNDHTLQAKKQFIDFSLQSQNSWINQQNFQTTILVIDASKGATSTVVKEIFSHYAFAQIEFTNLSTTGNINEYCGVADLEGKTIITENEIVPPTAIFHNYETLQTIWKIATSQHLVQNGVQKLVGIIFDGDGDRCFRLDYDHHHNHLLISNGDILGFQQAAYLFNNQSQHHHPQYFINTVESDLAVAIHAEEIGYQTHLTAVGDKWILFQALIATIKQSSKDPDFLKLIDHESQNPSPSGLALSKYYAENQLQHPLAELHFQIGFEESGHCITPALTKNDHLVLAGNGIKTALNALAAFQKSLHPFSAGIVKTYYIYYVQKSCLHPKHQHYKQFTQKIEQILSEHLPDLQYQRKEFSAEPEMLYYQLFQNSNMVGALFLRNSGTEDKAALYLRGTLSITNQLTTVGKKIHLYLLKYLKNQQHPLVTLEKKIILAAAQQNQNIIAQLLQDQPDLIKRLLQVMELKEELLQNTVDGYLLTEQGNQYLLCSATYT